LLLRVAGNVVDNNPCPDGLYCYFSHLQHALAILEQGNLASSLHVRFAWMMSWHRKHVIMLPPPFCAIMAPILTFTNESHTASRSGGDLRSSI
jgi:hypothetical protein